MHRYRYLFLFLLLTVSCSSFTHEDQIKIAGMSYTGLGVILKDVGKTIQSLHAEKRMSDSTFDEFAKKYNSILPLYKSAGNLQLSLMRLDPNETTASLENEQYESLIVQIKEILSQLISSLKDFGVNLTYK